MGLRTGLSAPARRLPDRLDDLHVARFLNAERLREDWPELRLLVSSRMRRACERKFGLSPAGSDAPLGMPG
jgi:hypothetical protein